MPVVEIDSRSTDGLMFWFERKTLSGSAAGECETWPMMGKGYGEYCPIANASEIIGERWTPLILRNIHLRCHTFSEIQQGCPRISSTLLAQRLRSLERDLVVERVASPNGRGSHYYLTPDYLTPAGQELAEVML